MRVINTGNVYRIYDDSLVTLEKFPAKNYVVRFSLKTGFYMEDYSDITINEKIYGVHEAKVDKVIRNFQLVEKSLGVILSGHKGIGKSLFAKMLSVKAVDFGMPVIIVDKYYPGIASYIESINQEVMVLFDEFDKTFDVKQEDGEANPQTEMLSLFDGLSQGKKLFVITCNDLTSLNSYLVNRPGRFHYHFRFDYPKEESIREYLTDKLDEKFYGEIDKVVVFSKKVDLNYDCLRAIAFELNTGESFETAIEDLNIINLNAVKYKLFLHYSDGTILKCKYGLNLDLFSGDSNENCYMYDASGKYICSLGFNTSDVMFDSKSFANIVPGDKLSINYSCYDDDDDDEVEKELENKFKNLTPEYLSLVRAKDKEIHYKV